MGRGAFLWDGSFLGRRGRFQMSHFTTVPGVPLLKIMLSSVLFRSSDPPVCIQNNHVKVFVWIVICQSVWPQEYMCCFHSFWQISALSMRKMIVLLSQSAGSPLCGGLFVLFIFPRIIFLINYLTVFTNSQKKKAPITVPGIYINLQGPIRANPEEFQKEKCRDSLHLQPSTQGQIRFFLRISYHVSVDIFQDQLQ